MRRLILALLITALPALALAQERGLIFNRSDLPAGLPLTLQFDKGDRWTVTLSDPETGADVLAAGAAGESPIRVLVPAGRWTIRAEGPEGRRDLGTRDFAVVSAARKEGWRLDLRGATAAAHPFAMCQTGVTTTPLPSRVDVPHNPATRSRLLREDRPGEVGQTLRDLRDPPRLAPIAAPETTFTSRPCK